MRLWRDDRPELDRLIALHAAKGSAEEVLHPDADTPRFDTAHRAEAMRGTTATSCRSRARRP